MAKEAKTTKATQEKGAKQETKEPKAVKAKQEVKETKTAKDAKSTKETKKFNLEDVVKTLTDTIKLLITKFQSLSKNQKIICVAIAGVILLSIASAIAQKRSDDFMCQRVDNLDSARFFGCDDAVKRLEAEEEAKKQKEEAEEAARRQKKEEEEKARAACESQTSDDGMKYSYDSYDGSCEKHETEKSCELRNLKLWDYNCVPEAEYKQKKAEYEAKQAAEKQAKSDCSAKGYDWNYTYDRCNSDAEQQKQNGENNSSNNAAPAEAPKQESSNNQPSAPAAPSIDIISDACWAYGKVNGVGLTDHASTEIIKDGDYYQIIMWHKDKSVWKCWYNPDNKDVFIEKTHN